MLKFLQEYVKVLLKREKKLSYYVVLFFYGFQITNETKNVFEEVVRLRKIK